MTVAEARRILDRAAQGQTVEGARVAEAVERLDRGGLGREDAERILAAAVAGAAVDAETVARATEVVTFEGNFNELRGWLGRELRAASRLGNYGAFGALVGLVTEAVEMRTPPAERKPPDPNLVRKLARKLGEAREEEGIGKAAEVVDDYIRKVTGFGALGVLREALAHVLRPEDEKFGLVREIFGELPRDTSRRSFGGPGPAAEIGEVSTPPPALEGRLRELAAELGIPDPEIDQMIQGMQLSAANQMALAADIPDLEPVGIGAMLEGQIRMLEAELEAARGAPLGVPPGFVAQRPIPGTARGGPGGFGLGVDPLEFDTEDVEPRYFQGDEFTPATLPAQIRRLQARLVEAGLLQEGSYWEGWWDDASAAAYRTVLEHANRTGRDADETLERLVRRHETEPEPPRPEFQPPPFIRPDPAALAQAVRSTFRTQVGRDPTPDELAEMSSVLGAGFRAAHDAEVAAQRAAFEADIRLAETGEPTDPGTFADVDPGARFREIFESRFRPERERLGSLDEVHQNTQNVMASLRTMSSLIGGGR